MLREWWEIYNTTEMEKCFRVENLLKEQNIKYKVDKINNNLRLSMNNTGGRMGAAAGRDKYIRDFYTISVRKGDESQARSLLSKIER